MKFSIITVCLNAGDGLIQTISSAIKQNFTDFEIIVKDGFSTDGSIEKIPKDDHIRIIQKRDKGIYDAMNQGISASRGDYLIFMNAGDAFYDNNVLNNISLFITSNATKLYYGKSYNKSLKAFDVTPPYIDAYFCFRSMICHQAMIFESSDIKRRGYDESFKICADRERLMYSVIKEKVNPRFIPVNIVLFQGGGLSASKEGKQKRAEENKRLIQKYYSRTDIFKYKIKYLSTFPHLRQLLTKNTKTYRIYKKIVGHIYGT